ncbi:MAG: DUF1579 domain-containing protein [Candidatus Omnitrophica bacterium]|nr:DUF1579 domain-containing protein [Candidatus Omnitrophota bacterium]
MMLKRKLSSILIFSLSLFSLHAAIAEDRPKMQAKVSVSEAPSVQEAAGQVQEKFVPQPPPDQETMMKKWQEFSTPNDNHKVLNQLVGEWSHTVKWWQSPKGDPETSEGASSIAWIMDGRFIEQNVTGMSMGQPFKGKAIVGYNNQKRVYETIWIDSMSTGIMSADAVYDAQSKQLKEEGHYACPLMNTDKKPYKAVTTFVGPDEFKYEMFTVDFSGEKFKTMEIVYHRVKQETALEPKDGQGEVDGKKDDAVSNSGQTSIEAAGDLLESEERKAGPEKQTAVQPVSVETTAQLLKENIAESPAVDEQLSQK